VIGVYCHYTHLSRFRSLRESSVLEIKSSSSASRRLPVVNEKHEVVGMLSLSDLVRKARVEASVIAATLQSICEPAHVPKQRRERIIAAG